MSCEKTAQPQPKPGRRQVIGIYRSAKIARKLAHLHALEHVFSPAASKHQEAVLFMKTDGCGVQWTVSWANNHTTTLAFKHIVTDWLTRGNCQFHQTSPHLTQDECLMWKRKMTRRARSLTDMRKMQITKIGSKRRYCRKWR